MVYRQPKINDDLVVMRGYFAIGVERLSKPMNAGNLFRTAHAFGASFVFTIDADYSVRRARSDTSAAPRSIPWYDYRSVDDFSLPQGCRLIGIELLDEAVDLPSFYHPANAAYVLGAERSSLTPALLARCDRVVRIPTRFCVNVATAGAIVMYDRALAQGRFAERPVGSLAAPIAVSDHVHGGPIRRRAKPKAGQR